jgi:hypothetical protein
MGSFKKLKSSDVITIPVVANKSWNFNYCPVPTDDPYVSYYNGINSIGLFNPDESWITNGQYDVLTYRQINQLFYHGFSSSLNTSSLASSLYYESASSSHPTASYFNFNNDPAFISNFPTGENAEIKVIQISPKAYGNKVLPYTFQMSSSQYNFYDDGKGNIYDNFNSDPPTHVGNIFYEQGTIVITNFDFQTLFILPPVAYNDSYTIIRSDYPNPATFSFNPLVNDDLRGNTLVNQSIVLFGGDISFFSTGSDNTVSMSFSGLGVGTYQTFYTFLVTGSYCAPLQSGIGTITVNVTDPECEFEIGITEIPPPTPSITPSISATPEVTISPTPSISISRTPSVTPSISVSRTPSTTPSISVSVTPSISISATPSVTPSISISATPSITPSRTPSISISRTPSITPSISISATPSVTPSISISRTPSVTPSISVSRTPSTTPSISISRTPSITPSISISRTPSVTPSVTPSISISATPSITPSISISRTPSVTPSISISATPSVTPGESISATPSRTPSISVTPSISISRTPSVTPSISISATPSITPSISISGTPSVTPSISVSVTPSVTPSISVSVTPSVTPSISISRTPSITPSRTPSTSISATPSITPSISISATPSVTPSISISATPSVTPSISVSATPSVTPSISITPSISVSATPSVTPSISISATPSVTPSISISRTPSVTPSITPSITPSTSSPLNIRAVISCCDTRKEYMVISDAYEDSIVTSTEGECFTVIKEFGEVPTITWSGNESPSQYENCEECQESNPQYTCPDPSPTPSVSITPSLSRGDISPSVTPSISISATPSVTPSTSISGCFLINLKYDNNNSIDACDSFGTTAYYTNASGGVFSTETTLLYSNSNCTFPAPTGYYVDSLGIWREWNGSSFIDNGFCL